MELLTRAEAAHWIQVGVWFAVGAGGVVLLFLLLVALFHLINVADDHPMPAVVAYPVAIVLFVGIAWFVWQFVLREAR